MDHRSQGVCNTTRTPRCCVPPAQPSLPAARCCFAGSRAGWVSNGNRASLNPSRHFPPASTFQGEKKQTLPSEQAWGRDLLAPSRGEAPVGGGVRGMSQGESSPPPHSPGKKNRGYPGQGRSAPSPAVRAPRPRYSPRQPRRGPGGCSARSRRGCAAASRGGAERSGTAAPPRGRPPRSAPHRDGEDREG